MKSINTVVADIQQVLAGGVEVPQERSTLFGERLGSFLAERLQDNAPRGTLRMSNFANPDCKLWYTVNNTELGEPLSPEARLKFNYGDIIEEYICFLIEQSDHDLRHRQLEVQYEGIVGHIDGILDGVLVDVKSCSPRTFDKFRYHQLERDDPFGYLDQLSLYATALQDHEDLLVKKQIAFLAVDKVDGRVCLDVYNVKQKDYKSEIIRKTGMLKGDRRPPRQYRPTPFGASGNQRLPMECSYCPFFRDCWKDACGGKGVRTFNYSSGQVHLTHVARVPEVEEIT